MEHEMQIIDEYKAAWEKAIEALTSLLETIVVKFVKRFCNTILCFALVTMKPEAKQVLKSKAYQPILRRKAALKGLTLRLAQN